MSKAVLVMDMPEGCYYCNFCDDDCRCTASEYKEIEGEMNISEEKPYWCPLKPMPEKMEMSKTQAGIVPSYKVGWNACIEAIEGSAENGRND